MKLLTDTQRRWLLAGIWVMWSVVGVAHIMISEARRWAPDLVGVGGLLAGICTLVLAIAPATVWAYRYAGTFATGTLVVRLGSIVLGLFRADEPDVVWIAASNGTLTLLLAGLWWYWWLGPVKDWHEDHKRIETSRRDFR